MKTKLPGFKSHIPPETNQISSFLVIIHSTIIQGNHLMSQIASGLKVLDLPNVEVCTVERLAPELTSQMGTVDCVLFVDVCDLRNTDIKILPLNACGLEIPGSSVPGLGHSWHPCSLLALTHSLYCHHPTSWWVKVASENLTGENQPSDEEQQLIQDAIEQVQSLIDSEQKKKIVESDNQTK